MRNRRPGEIELTERLLMVPQEDVVVCQRPVGKLELDQREPTRVVRPTSQIWSRRSSSPVSTASRKTNDRPSRNVSSHVIEQQSVIVTGADVIAKLDEFLDRMHDCLRVV